MSRGRDLYLTDKGREYLAEMGEPAGVPRAMLRLFQFYFNDFGNDHYHLVAAVDAGEAIRMFSENYIGVASDTLAMKTRNIENHTLLAIEDVRGVQMQVEWAVSEIDLKVGVLF